MRHVQSAMDLDSLMRVLHCVEMCPGVDSNSLMSYISYPNSLASASSHRCVAKTFLGCLVLSSCRTNSSPMPRLQPVTNTFRLDMMTAQFPSGERMYLLPRSGRI